MPQNTAFSLRNWLNTEAYLHFLGAVKMLPIVPTLEDQIRYLKAFQF